MKQQQIAHGCIYHIFNCGNNRENIFKEERSYTFFLSLMKKYLLPVASIYSFCLLKNHFHILLRIKERVEISNSKLVEKPHLAFSHLFNAYAKAINKAYSRSGSLFQKHFKRLLVDEESYLLQLITYIHLNHIKHGFSANLNYPYSSYKPIIAEQPTSIERTKIIDLFESKENFIYWHSKKQIDYSTIQKLIADDY